VGSNMGGKKNKENDIIVSFVGGSRDDVTGSCVLVSYAKENQERGLFAIEMGLIQGNFDVAKDISANRQMIENISLSTIRELEAVFLTHPHADHSCNLPICNSENGFKGRIISSHECLPLTQPIIEDSVKIHTDNIIRLKNIGKKTKPLYTKSNMNDMFDYMIGVDTHCKHKLNDYVEYEFINSGHVLGGCMINFYIKRNNGKIFRITYTGDMGSKHNNEFQSFVPMRDEIKTTDLLISEGTYNNENRSFTYQQSVKERDMLKKLIKQCISEGGNFLMPTFSFARCQSILCQLYEWFKDDKSMQDVDFILDGVLLHKINNAYIKVLQGEDKKYFKEVLKWKNLKLNKTHDGTTAILSNKGKQYVVLASSGFMVNGRVCEYLQQFIGSSKDYICATGYCGGVGSIGYQILDKSQPVVKINGSVVYKSAHIFQLKTFSSHIQFDELIELFAKVNCKKILVHHSSEDGKYELVKQAREEISKANKTTNIIAVDKGSQQFVF
jgi:metallo-beta-lactamase family protein